MTPFIVVPRAKFVMQLIAPAIPLLIFLILCVGVLVNSGEFQEKSGPTEVTPFWKTSALLYQDVFSSVQQLPEVCLWGTAVNEFQQRQCDRYWTHLLTSSGLAAAPFGVLALLLAILLDQVEGVYRSARKKIDQGKAAFKGTVTDPPAGPQDIFSWFYCFRPVMIQLENKTQMKVYVSGDLPCPLPGESLAVFAPTHSLGEKRHLAILFSPHVAVIRGT